MATIKGERFLKGVGHAQISVRCRWIAVRWSDRFVHIRCFPPKAQITTHPVPLQFIWLSPYLEPPPAGLDAYRELLGELFLLPTSEAVSTKSAIVKKVYNL
ncbi:MAG: hypothetical protein HKP52_12425 [Desulfofustis sp.]|nr:hypothetical protein [Desulfofustis sp.]